jgi:resuscitation-promoting factor RpfB
VNVPPALLSAARRPAVPLVIGVVLTALLASGVAWSLTGKTALLSVDGQVQEVDFRGGTVEDVLAAAGLEAGERDVLVPSADSEVEDGERIALRRARLLTLVVDGREKQVWVTAASVDEALDQIGLRDGALALSASRSRSIPLDGFRLAVTTPKDISIIADNAVKPLSTTAPTVRDALIEAGVRLDRDDRISATRTTPVTDRMVIRVTRISTVRTTETVAVPFGTERREDADLFKGETKTLQAGRAGAVRRTVEVVYADGALEKRTVLSSTTLSAPVTRILAVGTKARPAAASSNTRRSTGGSADSLNWPALARCESGGNPRAVSSTGKYRGLYQFSLATWRSVGGQGDPIDNSAGEQTYRAKLLYERSGAGQWPHCGKHLFT